MISRLDEILVVSDMDGTLLGTDTKLPGCNLETIRLFTMLGGHFAVATGRIPQSIGKYKELVPYLSPCIASNGCMIYDFGQKQIVAQELLPQPAARNAVEEAMRRFPDVGVMVFIGNDAYLCNSSRETQVLVDDEKITYRAQPLEELPGDWNKMIFCAAPERLAEVQHHVLGQQWEGVEFVLSSDIYFEMLPENITKGTALKDLCEIVGIPLENTFAIGDYYNDVGMLKAAGHSVAMENAPADIRMIADETAARNDEGGVGQFLYKLIRIYGGI